jgi:hypothetical protein
MFEILRDAWLSLQAWWQSLTPDSQALLRDGAVLLGAFLAGQVLGRVVGQKLQATNFDASLRVPWSQPSTGELTESQTLTPTRMVGGLVRWTVWGAAVWWVAHQHGWAGPARALELIAGRVWVLAVVLVLALYLGRFVAEQLIDFLKSAPLEKKLEEWSPRAAGPEQRASVVVLAGAVVYGVAAGLVLLIAADLLGWTMTGAAVAAVWHLALLLLTGGAALLIGWLGAHWARALATPDVATASPPALASYYTALGILVGTTLLAVTLLAGSSQPLAGLVLVLLLALVLWPLREHVRDVWAGILLKSQKVQQVRIDGEWCQLYSVGLLVSQLTRGEERLTRRNRLVLEAYLQGTSRKDAPPR